MFRLLDWLRQRRRKRTHNKVADLQTALEAKDRTIRILETERDNLAAVIARDRLRVQAETAVYAKQKAEAESGRTR